jgi:hypothetical protein
VVRERVAAVGLDPSGYSGHSLRAGLAISVAQVGVPTWRIRQHTRHTSEAMLLRYVHDSRSFTANAALKVATVAVRYPLSGFGSWLQLAAQHQVLARSHTAVGRKRYAALRPKKKRGSREQSPPPCQVGEKIEAAVTRSKIISHTNTPYKEVG